MNRLIIVLNTIISLLMTHIGYGQGFNKYFGGYPSSYPRDVFVNNDSSYTIMSVRSNPQTGQPGLAMFNFDKNGTLILQKSHFSNTPKGFNFYYRNKMAVPISNSSFLVLGAYYNSNNLLEFFVTKINRQTLDTVWTRYYNDLLYSTAVSHILKVSGNKYWLIGNKFDEDDPTYAQRPVILQTDTLGNISFQKEILALTNTGIDVANFDLAQNVLYISGRNFSISYSQERFVAALDTSANIKWYQQIGNSNHSSQFLQMEKRNNDLVLCGSRYKQEVNSVLYLELTLLKLNALTGAIQWQKVFPGTSTFAGLFTLHINNDGSIITAGEYQRNMQAYSDSIFGIVLKTDSNGTCKWAKLYNNYGKNVQELFINLKPTLDKGYILCGQSISAPSPQSWAVKTDSLGNAPDAINLSINTVSVDATPILTQLQTPQNSGSFSISPNPASGSIVIQSDKVSQILSLKINDMLGRDYLKLKDFGASTKEIKLDINFLPAGIYNVQITLMDGNVVNSKIVKE